MKKAAMFLLLAAAVACEKDADTKLVALAVQSWFEDDHVNVSIDGLPMIDQVVNTNPSLGVCYIENEIDVRKHLKKGKHLLRVTVNDVLTHTTEFDLTSNVFIGIGYDETEQVISFVYSPEPFVYD